MAKIISTTSYDWDLSERPLSVCIEGFSYHIRRIYIQPNVYKNKGNVFVLFKDIPYTEAQVNALKVFFASILEDMVIGTEIKVPFGRKPLVIEVKNHFCDFRECALEIVGRFSIRLTGMPGWQADFRTQIRNFVQVRNNWQFFQP